jgi:hypothetical protein
MLRWIGGRCCGGRLRRCGVAAATVLVGEPSVAH